MTSAVIVCTRNRSSDLNEFLATLNFQTRLPEKVLIVDSSNPQSKIDYSILSNIESRIEHIESIPGLTIQRNVGLSLTKDVYDYLHFFDDDVLLEPDYLEIANSVFQQHRKVVGVCGRTPDNPLTGPRALKRFFLLDSKKSGKLQKSGINVGFRKQGDAYLVDWMPGCCMSYKSSAVGSKIFDETRANVGWGEDVDFSARIASIGDLLCEPRLGIFHKLSSVNRDSTSTRFIKDLESRFKLAKDPSIRVTKMGIMWSLLGEFIISILQLSRAVAGSLLDSTKQILRTAKLLIKSILRGLHNAIGQLWYLLVDVKEQFLRLWFYIKAINSGNFESLEKSLLKMSPQSFCIKLTGGVGNQLFGWALGVTLARKNNVIPVYDTSAFNGRNPRDLGIEELEIQKSTKKIIRNATVRIQETSLAFDPGILNAEVGAYLEGYFQSYKYFKDSETEIRSILLQQRQRHLNWFREVGAFNTIQYRRGDYLNAHNRGIHGVLDDEYFIKGANYVQECGSTDKFIIFSDSIEHALELSKNIPNSQVDLIVDSPLDTMLRMSHAKNFVISNSTFGWWSAWLGNPEAENVIAPPYWLKSQDLDLDDIFLPNWKIL
jgi:GT2 family glycosyltransferase